MNCCAVSSSNDQLQPFATKWGATHQGHEAFLLIWRIDHHDDDLSQGKSGVTGAAAQFYGPHYNAEATHGPKRATFHVYVVLQSHISRVLRSIIAV